LYTSPNIIRQIKSRIMRWVGHGGTHGRGEKSDKVMGKPEGMRPLERPRHRWKDGIKMNLGEIGWEGVAWSHLAQDRNHWGFFEHNGEPLGTGVTVLGVLGSVS
jgi:hypothetical protein